MAKIPQGILGGIRGRVGNVVGAAWRGINYIRSMPLSVANPNTSAQQAQRGAFTQVVLVARLLLSNLVANYWDPFARSMSGYNHFISINIASFTTAGFTTFATFFSSRGILTGFVDLVVTAAAGTSLLTFGWTDNSGTGDALAADRLFVVWYNETQGYWKSFYPGAGDRDAGAVTVADDDMAENDELHVYPFFTRTDVSRLADSEYKAATVAA